MSALFDLEEVIRAKQVKLTPQEVNVLYTCKSKARRDFFTGTLLGGTLMWAATWRLRRIYRTELATGAGIGFGFWNCTRSLDSCLDHILALDGSLLQYELAAIIAKKYGDDPSKMQLLSKRFYSEKVYDDSGSGPKLKWRFRNYYSDGVTHEPRTSDDDLSSQSHSNTHSQTPIYSHNDSQNDTVNKKTDLGFKQTPVNSDTNLMADPLDGLFGDMSTTQDIPHANTPSSTPSRVPSRSHRRSHRRRRMRHQEASLDSQND
ncbi:hypothetical protein SLEP1_g29849 [Rubroshorea leprosula]|uniref:Uncharacterized protein n=2 Tax=Rubroshorea leprosula TaxID=152421 RepID=A0AAV5K7Z6_9ROSI|nr:hypothetical protein SLEP1_g29849 [Rubroshorea leprosula]